VKAAILARSPKLGGSLGELCTLDGLWFCESYYARGARGGPRRAGTRPTNRVCGLEFGVQLALGVHDRFVDLGGLRGEAGDAHEVVIATGVEGGLTDLSQIVAEVFDQGWSDFGFHLVCRFRNEFLVAFSNDKRFSSGNHPAKNRNGAPFFPLAS